jgi:hypothetical protein
MQFLITHLPLVSCNSSLLGPDILSATLLSNTLNLPSYINLLKPSGDITYHQV